SSLLNLTRRMIAVRKQHRAFGRGLLSFLYPSNRKVLAYIREYEDERILCVFNLSRAAQSVELDLSAWRGGVPIELTGGSAFPPIGDLPYMLTLPAYGFFWFLIAPEADVPRWHTPTPEPLPEFITVTLTRGDLAGAVAGRDGRLLENDVLPEFLRRQRWFAAKDVKIEAVSVIPIGALANTAHRLFLLEVRLPGGESQSYFLPLTVLWGEETIRFGAPKLSYTLAKARSGRRIGALLDATRDEGFIRDLAAAIRAGGIGDAEGGQIAFEPTEAFRALGELESVRPLSVEQSNISAIVGEATVLKVYRRLQAGRQPELEMGRFLTEVAGFPNTPAYLGAAEYRPEAGEATALASAFTFVPNQGDAWGALVDALDRSIEDWTLAERVDDGTEPREIDYGFPLDFALVLGRRTAELHGALAIDTDDPAFRREPVTTKDVGRWVEEASGEADRAFARLQAARPSLSGAAAEAAEEILDSGAILTAKLEALRELSPSGAKTRTHGDYHLGQVLVAQTDAMIIDFEGEPQRALEARRRKTSPLRDVAGMLRSFDYAAWAALGRLDARHGEATPEMRRQALAWRRFSEHAFLETYRFVAEGSPHYPSDAATAQGLIDLFLLEKALYEIGYEAANRPGWLPIPIRGVLDLLRETRQDDGTA
ncbi:MAG TPA: putative maltokinase, partial [Afifellaceae bacterium]|nr:putative maltokinase [Afifellaceae bacterium]